MKPCSSCNRHVQADASQCVFCGQILRSTGGLLRWELVLGVALAACGPAAGTGSGSATGGSPTTNATTMAATGTRTTTGMSSEGATAFSTTIDESDSLSDGCGGFYGGCAVDFLEADCDLFEQDCPEGEKCNPWADNGGSVWDASKCVPLVGNPAGIGDPCEVEGSGVSGLDSCELGSMCWDVDAQTNEGTCIGLCSGSLAAPECAEGDVCLITNEGVLPLCFRGCTADGDECLAGDICFTGGEQPICIPGQPPVPGEYGTSCEDIAACNPGLTCFGGPVPGCEASACCTALCDPMAKNTCPDAAIGQTCEAVAGRPEAGICVIP